MVEILCAVLAVIVAGLTLKLWHYRTAIIQLQADMTLVLNELTRPPLKQSIMCNLCETRMSPSEYAHHFCERLTSRAQAMNAAKEKHQHAYDAR